LTLISGEQPILPLVAKPIPRFANRMRGKQFVI
jgi:hypothetical protein